MDCAPDLGYEVSCKEEEGSDHGVIIDSKTLHHEDSANFVSLVPWSEICSCLLPDVASQTHGNPCQDEEADGYSQNLPTSVLHGWQCLENVSIRRSSVSGVLRYKAFFAIDLAM